MKNESSKYIFNAIIFLAAGIISLLRQETLEALVSFMFCSFFFILSFILRESETNLLTEEGNQLQ